jgi:hypothetical protein
MTENTLGKFTQENTLGLKNFERYCWESAAGSPDVERTTAGTEPEPR